MPDVNSLIIGFAVALGGGLRARKGLVSVLTCGSAALI